MKYLKKLACIITVLALLSSFSTVLAAKTAFSDVPEGSWAEDYIAEAVDFGLIKGLGDGSFGYGQNISRAEFVTIVVRMFEWAPAPNVDAFTDIASSWARGDINTAAANGVMDAGGRFRPTDFITREEMAVMLVRALGYNSIAMDADSYSLPFTDVTTNRGYITVAYDIGMTNGTSASSPTFDPSGSATREQAATMLLRVYKKLHSDVSWSHAFYAISSYSQLSLAKEFDAISFGWSRMYYDDSGARLSTSASDGNEYYIPSGYAEAVSTLKAAGTSMNLSVFMSGTQLVSMLSDSTAVTAACDAIVLEATRTYDALGYSPYSGVTIDFEGLRATSRDDFTAFLTELTGRLSPLGLSLYVTVMPATPDGVYYDGYDYRAIGAIADKVILMAHDYSASSMAGFIGSTYYKTAALAPISSVYYSLRVASDSSTGVEDASKLVLAVSLSSAAWQTDSAGLLSSDSPLHPTPTTIYSRLKSGASMGWSTAYRSPYVTYVTESGQNIFLWYEDSRSISEKLALARLFGVSGVSAWRLGLIPDYTDAGLSYDVASVLA